MNGLILAAIAVVALLVGVVLWKKRTSPQSKQPGEPARQPDISDKQPPVQQPKSAPEIASTSGKEAPPAADDILAPSPELHSAAKPAISELEEISSADMDNLQTVDALDETVQESSIAELQQESKETAAAPIAEEAESQPAATPTEPHREEGAAPSLAPEPPAEVIEKAEKPAVPVASSIESRSTQQEEFLEVAPTSEPAAAVDTLPPQIELSLEEYSARLNHLEEKQRALLTQAIQQRDDKLRDQLQRELVIMNDKLALLEDSYAQEKATYQRILDTLTQLQNQADEGALTAARKSLLAGDPQAAETLCAQLSERQDPFAALAAYSSAQLAECRGDLRQALTLYRRAVELDRENLVYLQAAGKTARSLFRYNEALPWLEAFVKLAGEQESVDPVKRALAQRELAYTYVLSGQYQKAGPLYKESMTMLAKELGQDHQEMAASWYQLGELQETLGEYDKAVSLYKKSLAIFEKTRGQEHPILAGILDKLAALCMELEMEKQAVPLYERLVQIREKALRATHPQLALSLNNLAESYRLQGRYAEAEACYQKSLVINETLHGNEHPSVAAILQELAKLCTSQRKAAEAQQYQQRASAIFQKSVDASEKKTGQESLTLEI